MQQACWSDPINRDLTGLLHPGLRPGPGPLQKASPFRIAPHILALPRTCADDREEHSWGGLRLPGILDKGAGERVH